MNFEPDTRDSLPALDDTQPTLPLRLPMTPRQTATTPWRLILGVTVVALLVLVLLGGLYLLANSIQDETPQPFSVTLMLGSENRELKTFATTVGEVLNEAGISVKPSDLLSVPIANPVTDGMVIELRPAREISLKVDGELMILHTAFDNPLDILKDAGVIVDSSDLIYVDGTQTDAASLVLWPVPATNITVKHALAITVTDDGTDTAFNTTAVTVGEALFQAGVTLYLGDTVLPDLNAPITENLIVMVDRSRPVTIVADGVSIETRTRGRTVGEALAESGVPLVGMDYAIPNEFTDIVPGLSIRVIRVTEEIITEQAQLPYESIYQADSTLELDARSILQGGQRGTQETVIRVRYENGIEINRETESTTVVTPPVNELVAYGTNIVLRTVDTPDGAREYWRHFRVYATSYHPAALGGDNVTATGRILTRGIVGIDPTIIPYGTRMYVPGYGEGVAADTGGPRSHRYWIDLGYDDENYVSWSRWVDVYLLTPIPDKIDYLLPTPPQ